MLRVKILWDVTGTVLNTVVQDAHPHVQVVAGDAKAVPGLARMHVHEVALHTAMV